VDSAKDEDIYISICNVNAMNHSIERPREVTLNANKVKTVDSSSII
jgi:hypothetical protein